MHCSRFRLRFQALMVLLSLLWAGTAGAQPGTETVGIHGMLVFGGETIYVSHLPMFMPQHRYQGIWEVSFGEEGDRAYRAERARSGNAGKIFTLEPLEKFRLPELTSGRTSFTADVFLGHFERTGNRLLLPKATVTLRRTVHWHPFRAVHARTKPLTYVLFGQGKETYLAHWISTSPNYDQVLAVTPALPLAEIPAGAQVVLPSRDDGEPLRAGESVAALLIADRGPEQAALVVPIDLTVSAEIYMEKGELAENMMPPEPR
jgi:hypothetical protein